MVRPLAFRFWDYETPEDDLRLQDVFKVIWTGTSSWLSVSQGGLPSAVRPRLASCSTFPTTSLQEHPIRLVYVPGSSYLRNSFLLLNYLRYFPLQNQLKIAQCHQISSSLVLIPVSS
ncbi:hypothetical protein L798_00909 [Zootermopsis nevadensis]|uniref:Uncharacterized protein n=1 Tax=Zootermopsis nevadensis TaxID=136037 RepID=A0A067QKA0_ZOONE|nr:hypothetical protein L798_00909 [Zootermopsis nevadensis]